MGTTTPTDSRSRRIRASRRGGHLLTRALSPSCETGLPILRSSQRPCPGGSQPTRQAAVGQPGVRPFIPDTNTIEALHRQIRKTIKTRGHFPTEEAARKLIYLSIISAKKSWKQTYHWSSALLSFKIHFGDRLP